MVISHENYFGSDIATKIVTQSVTEGEMKQLYGLPGTKHTILEFYKSKSAFTPEEEAELQKMVNASEMKTDARENNFGLRDFYLAKIDRLPKGAKSMEYQRDTQCTIANALEDS